MRTIVINKLVINIGVGEAGEKLIKAENVIQLIVPSNAITTWNKDAQVLSSTCPKWGNLVVGFQ